MNHRDYIDQAIKVAKRSSHKKFMMGAVVVNRQGEIIANGWQHSGTWRMRELYSTHAELHCLFKLRHMKGQLDDCEIYVAGVARKSGNIVRAAPCIRCATSLFHAGFKHVYFSTPNPISSHIPVVMNNVLELVLSSANCKEYPVP